MDYEPVIGLEFHAQLKTNSKLFCGCKNDTEEREPNIYICPVCLGMPGTLPVLNKKAVELVILAGLALNGKINKKSKFDRKHYFYPDLPKGYQISQYDEPLVLGGFIPFKDKKLEIRRIHLEEDTGRMIHPEGKNYSLIDYNRSGTPLMELVTEPTFKGAEEAKFFAEELQRVLVILGISSAEMENGNLRCEANVSLRKSGEKKLPNYKVEIKNLNSFKALFDGINFEIERQEKLLKNGEVPKQETRGWDASKKETFPQRSKENAEEYRYFPDPDLPPLLISEEEIEVLRLKVQEMPWQTRERLISSGVPSNLSNVFVDNRNLLNFLIKSTNNLLFEPSETSKFIAGDFVRTVSELGLSLKDNCEEILFPDYVYEIISMLKSKEISRKLVKEHLSEIIAEKVSPKAYFSSKGILLESNEESLEAVVRNVLEKNKKAVDDYKKGKTAVLGFLIGQVMKETKGQANPNVLKHIIERVLVEY